MNYGKLFCLTIITAIFKIHDLHITSKNLPIFSLLNATLEDAARKYNASYHPLLESYEEYENVSKNRIPDRDSLDFARGIERGRGINYYYKPSSTDKYCLKL